MKKTAIYKTDSNDTAGFSSKNQVDASNEVLDVNGMSIDPKT